jgi:hypothetical protein
MVVLIVAILSTVALVVLGAEALAHWGLGTLLLLVPAAGLVLFFWIVFGSAAGTEQQERYAKGHAVWEDRTREAKTLKTLRQRRANALRETVGQLTGTSQYPDCDRPRPDYDTYILSGEWLSRRQQKFRELGREACENPSCLEGPTSRMLRVHHLTYDRLGCERMSDLVALCDACHTDAHGTAIQWNLISPEAVARQFSRAGLVISYDATHGQSGPYPRGSGLKPSSQSAWRTPA